MWWKLWWELSFGLSLALVSVAPLSLGSISQTVGISTSITECEVPIHVTHSAKPSNWVYTWHLSPIIAVCIFWRVPKCYRGSAWRSIKWCLSPPPKNASQSSATVQVVAPWSQNLAHCSRYRALWDNPLIGSDLYREETSNQTSRELVHYSKIVLLSQQFNTISRTDMTLLQARSREYCYHVNVHTQKCGQKSNAIYS